MTDKQFRRLSRADLIEIIYELQQSEKALEQENEQLKQQLEQRQFAVSQAGTLAEALSWVNGLFDAAQATADDYIAEAKRARAAALAMLDDARRSARETNPDITASRAMQQTHDGPDRSKEEGRSNGEIRL